LERDQLLEREGEFSPAQAVISDETSRTPKCTLQIPIRRLPRGSMGFAPEKETASSNFVVESEEALNRRFTLFHLLKEAHLLIIRKSI
jgi:hypothetical protein